MTVPARVAIAWAIPVLVAMLLLPGCGAFTDAATRLASDIEAAAGKLKKDGDRVTLHHQTPSRRGQCDGAYSVQLDEVGALVFWCRDDDGKVVSSPGTSSHRRFVRTLETYRVDKQAGEPLVIELERRGREAVIVDVH